MNTRRLSTLVLSTCLLLSGCDRLTSTDTRITRATTALDAGKYQAALVDLRKALNKEPNNIAAHLLLVDVLAASGEFQQARAELEQAIAAGAPAKQTEARKLRLLVALSDGAGLKQSLAKSTSLLPEQRSTFEGRLLLLQRRPVDAQAAFERALAANPAFTDASLGRIEALATAGRSRDAMQAADELIARVPDSGGARLIKGTLAAQARDYATATKAFTAAIDRGRGLNHMEVVQAYAERTEAYLLNGQIDAAQLSLTSMNAVAGDSAVTSYLRAEVALANKDANTAVNELRNFTQALPQHMTGRLLLTMALLEQGSTEQAFAEAARNVSEFGSRDEPVLALAEVQLRLGRATDAEETLRPLITRSPPNAQAVAMLAEVRARNGETVAAVSLLEQGVADNPRNSRLKLQLAAAYLSTGDAKRSQAVLDGVDDPSLISARERMRVIATAVARGSAQAQNELESAVTRHPDDPDLLLMAAAYHAGADHVEQALRYLQKARALRPGDSTLPIMQGRLELSRGQADAAAALANGVLEKSPNDVGAMMLLASVASSRGQNAEVDAWLNRARISNPNAVAVRLALAQSAAARGNVPEARNLLAEAARSAPSDTTPRIALAELDASAGRYAEALENLRRVALDKPNSPPLYLAMARVQLAAKDTAAARKSLQQALELAPRWVPAATTLAALEVSAGKLPAALDVVRQMRQADPDGASSWALEGDVYLAVNRPADAAAAFVTAYRRAPSASLATRAAKAKLVAKLPNPDVELADWLSRRPDDAIARRAFSEYLVAVGRPDAAINELEKVIAARPQDYAALNNLAWLYHLKKDPRALNAAEKAFAGAPQVPGIADTYGVIMVDSGSLEKGLGALEKAASLLPQDAEVQYHYAHALAKTNDRQRAVELLRRTLNTRAAFDSRKEAELLLAQLSGGKTP